jgi:hypothetical protein
VEYASTTIVKYSQEITVEKLIVEEKLLEAINVVEFCRIKEMTNNRVFYFSKLP